MLNGITSFMLAYSTVFSTFLNFAQIPTQIYEAIIGFTDSKVVFLLIVNLVLLVIGCFVDSVPAMVVMAPLLLPAAESFGLNPVHFGIIMSVNLAIGLAHRLMAAIYLWVPLSDGSRWRACLSLSRHFLSQQWWPCC